MLLEVHSLHSPGLYKNSSALNLIKKWLLSVKVKYYILWHYYIVLKCKINLLYLLEAEKFEKGHILKRINKWLAWAKEKELAFTNVDSATIMWAFCFASSAICHDFPLCQKLFVGWLFSMVFSSWVCLFNLFPIRRNLF